MSPTSRLCPYPSFIGLVFSPAHSPLNNPFNEGARRGQGIHGAPLWRVQGSLRNWRVSQLVRQD